jgi:hypothetical protein
LEFAKRESESQRVRESSHKSLESSRVNTSVVEGSLDESSEPGDLSAMPQDAVTKIPIYGIAKRFEWLYPPEGEVVRLPRRSLALRLLQKIRDESHRFAITYHRKLRAKSFITTS